VLGRRKKGQQLLRLREVHSQYFDLQSVGNILA